MSSGVPGPSPDCGAAIQSEHLRTDLLDRDLESRAVRSGALTLGGQIASLVLSVGSTMVLARLLRPADFGLLAMVFTLTVLLDTFKDLGLPVAVQHRETIDDGEMNKLFWLNAKLNLGVVVFMSLMGPGLAWFYRESRLAALTPFMAVGLFFFGLSAIHEALLKRQLRFAAQTTLEVVATAVGVVAGIVAAVIGAGYWALALLFVVTAVTRCLIAWHFCKWRPSRMSAAAAAPVGLSSFVSYGSYLAGARFFDYLGRNMDRILIGHLAGAGPLGLYANALRWSAFPVRQLHHPLKKVAVPSLSRVQSEPERYRAMAKSWMLPFFAGSMPVLAFLALEARAVILVLLGNQWVEAVPLLQMLSIATMAGLIGLVTRWLYYSQGRTRRQFAWSLISTPVMLVAVALGATRGAYGVAVAIALSTWLLAYPTVAYCVRHSQMQATDFLEVLWRPALSSTVAAGVLVLVGLALPETVSVVLRLLASLGIFGIAYAVSWLLLPGGRRILSNAVLALRGTATAGEVPRPSDSVS